MKIVENMLIEAAQEVCAFMAEQGWRFCIIGGLAVQCWGEPRTTMDVDFTLLTEWGTEERFITPLLARFESRIADPENFARAYRILLLRASNGKEVDIALGALPFEEKMVQRAVPIEFSEGVSLPCCTAEDLFIMKAYANRPKDWADAEAINVRQKILDKQYVMDTLAELCALRETPDVLERVQKIWRETA